MFTECLQYGRYRARYYRDKQYTPTKRNTESNAGRPLSKEITIKQMAKMLREIKFTVGKNVGKETCW